MIRRVLLLLPLLLVACAQGPGLRERLSVWVGRSEGDLVAEFGVPVRTYEADGRRFLQYEQRRTVAFTQPGFDRPYFTPWGPRFGYFPAPPAYATVGCDLTFTIRDGRVEDFSFRGQGCG
ncbi:MAG TPA: hypothetical protein VGN83_07250 [Falsiroseomonas sp.]|jgi:hypothetical protein|nr:hypothetical protein [Falsiroseomonas sp.]